MLEAHIQKRFEGFGLDVAFAAGDELVVLFGPSGAGKSVTLRTIAGIAQADSGRIRINGRSVYDSGRGLALPPQVRHVGYVPQNYALFPHLTAEKNIGFGLKGVSRTEYTRRVADLIALFRLEGLEYRRPHEMSGGQQQRVAVARAMARQPEVLLLDEPFGALDGGIRSEIRQELIDLQQRTAMTIVAVTHDLAEAFHLGQRVVVMDEGRVLQAGTREDIFYRPSARRVAELVGTRNILRARVGRRNGGLLSLNWKGQELLAASEAALPYGAEVDVCIRPTQVMIRRPDDHEDSRNGLRGAIVQEVVGHETHRLFVRLFESIEPYDLEIDLPGYVFFRLGLDRRKNIEMSVHPESVHIIPVVDPAGPG